MTFRHPHNLATNTLRRPASRDCAAFTLLELILALLVVAMIAAALSAAMTVAFKARDAAVNGLGDLRQARVAMDMIGKDIQGALPPTGVLVGAFTATPNDGGSDLDMLEFFNSAPPGPIVEGAGDVQKVHLAVMTEGDLQAAPVDPDMADPRASGPRLAPPASDDTSDMVLVRQVTRRLMAQDTPQPGCQVIVRHVMSFKVRLYDGTQWLDTWDSTTQDNTLPLAVEVTLQIQPGQGQNSSSASATNAQAQPYVLTRVFILPCASPATDDSQSQGNGSSSGTGRLVNP
jgi:type II secretory pathway component PulJ